ncbi:MAG: MerR family transcriptional regulator [Treponema sp.]|nr:MerR family transcriptional regulator [Treponema sp.]MDE6244030.1 MerR family transcriptional regulator [Treponemataceae bacterium]MBD5407615.1 MerR family transcriptional regulator [Treponema sp.]MBD5410386.1 MerR family transcriptional regulator [Treponema sp.]MBD5412014.1 MerR family transcriptional regulator [Treponema sp.]
MTFSIGQIEDLTGVKAYVLRYWEEVIPGFAVQKDMSGRRIYSQNEFELILKLKHFIQEKKFTIEGARNQIIADAEAINKEAKIIKQIRDLKLELTNLYLTIKKTGKKNA